MKIRHVKNREIDKKRWDCLIDEAPNGRIYAYSWYLDIVAKNWDALVAGDYEFVMPVPFNTKYGITYSMNPYFIQQLGVFSRKKLSDEIFCAFLQALPWKIKYLNLNINAPELFTCQGLKTKRRTNYIVDINCSYDEIKARYHTNVRRTLQKENSFRLVETTDSRTVIQNYRNWNGHLVPFRDKDYYTMAALVDRMNNEKHLITCLLLDEKDEILASGFLFTSHRRVYDVLSAQSPDGKTKNARYFFMDHFFRQYHHRLEIFDFEGSELPGVAEFIRKWGAVPEYYLNIEYAKFPVNLLK